MSASRTCESELLEGTVLELRGDFALVDLEAASSCGSCCQSKACFPEGAPRHKVLVKNTRGLSAGARITLEQNGLKQFQLSALHYGVPLAGFLMGIAIGSFWQPLEFTRTAPELWQFALGICFIILGGLAARYYSGKIAKSGFAVFSMR